MTPSPGALVRLMRKIANKRPSVGGVYFRRDLIDFLDAVLTEMGRIDSLPDREREAALAEFAPQWRRG